MTKFTTIRNSNKVIIGYQTVVHGRTQTIERIDAIGDGVCYQVNRYIFDSLASAKAFVAKARA